MDFFYGNKSTARLETCDPRLFTLAVSALQMSPYDITIVHGWRGEELQNTLFDSGASTKKWPDSMHNKTVLTPNRQKTLPRSLAVDFAPWINSNIPWDDTHIFAAIAGCFLASSKLLNIPIRWGGDWDGDGSTKDQHLMDWGHIELVIQDGA